MKICFPGGSQLVPHLYNALRDQYPTHIMLQIDIKNAFGSIKRKKILESLIDSDFKYLVPWFISVYGHSNIISFTDSMGLRETHTIHEAISQGGVLSSFYFSLAIHQVLIDISQYRQDEDPMFRITPVAVMDDLTLLGPVESIQEIYPRLLQSLQQLGLSINGNKLKALSPEAFTGKSISHDTIQLGRDLIQINTDGLVLCGVPFGTTEFCHQYLNTYVESAEQGLNGIQQFPSLQGQLHLIRYCWIQEFTHIIRSLPPAITQNLATSAYNTIEIFLRRNILQLSSEGITTLSKDPNMDQLLSQRLFMRFQQGGLGILHLLKVHKIGYLGGCGLLFAHNEFLPELVRKALTKSIDQKADGLYITLSMAWEKYQHSQWLSHDNHAIKPLSDYITLATKNPQLQSVLYKGLVSSDMLQCENLLQGDQYKDNLSHWKSASNPSSSYFLRALPSNESLSIPNDVFIIALRIFLDIPLELGISDVLCCSRKCKETSWWSFLTDLHLQKCRTYGMYTYRHHKLLGVLRALLSDTNIPFRVEPRGLDNKRPDLLLQLGLQNLYLDVTTVHVKQKKWHNKDRLTPAIVIEEEKQKKHGELAQRQNAKMYGLCFESGGAMGPGFHSLFHDIMSHNVSIGEIDDRYNWTAASFKSYWYQVLSVTYWKATASLLIKQANMVRHLPVTTFDPQKHPDFVLQSDDTRINLPLVGTENREAQEVTVSQAIQSDIKFINPTSRRAKKELYAALDL